jgi:Tfp pilus assembly protein PilV
MSITSHKPKSGVTVIEVLFATGIVIFGLIGIASLISVAGRQASQANEVAEAQALARRWYSEFVARGYNNSALWRWYNDQGGASTVAGNFTVFTNKTPAIATLSSSTSTPTVRTRFRNAICIDPLFFSDSTTIDRLQSAPAFSSGQAYRPGLFPYYQDNFNPTSDPFTPAFGSDMPRLLRVSLATAVGSGVLPAKLVEQIFMSSDDFAIQASESDQTLSAGRLLDSNTARLQSKLEYSWLATLSPREFTAAELASGPELASPERQYTLAIVVLHRRDRQFFAPALSGPENSPQGERILSVSAHPGAFRNGSGGRITVEASTAVSDRLRVGDWVMLSRHQDTATAGRSVVCRWYRILGMDAEPTVGGTTWSRSIIIDGPDWAFSATMPTQVTVLNNVVTVLERVIEVK